MAEILKIGRVHNKELLTNPKDPTVSKLHLQLFIDDDYNVFVTDLNSSNVHLQHSTPHEPCISSLVQPPSDPKFEGALRR